MASQPSPPSAPSSEDAKLSAKEIKYRSEMIMAHDRSKLQDSLITQISTLESQLESLNSQVSSTTEKLENPPKATIKQHIKLLHDFNEIRDVGLHLIGMIADERGVGLKEVLGEFGVTEKD
ncbi:hypothetical protein TWF703_010433 [Orbilia oligospora]|uniref:Swi5-domain-containing protein n=2 Tax=Orbilia oligospora TaxID=2813651 RepID=A0A7C8NK00_ORBOL|nr:hypothetical protein TWF703_010433 [Orbilia oligospora]